MASIYMQPRPKPSRQPENKFPRWCQAKTLRIPPIPNLFYNPPLYPTRKPIIMRLKNLFPLALLLASTFAQAVAIQRWHNANGTQILLVERHELPIVDYAVIFKGAGSTAEPDGKSDIATATASMLTRGTQKLDEETFTARINDLGSSISGSSSFEYSIFSFRSLSDSNKLVPTADLLNQALTQPRFEQAVLERLQNRAVLSLRQAQSYPAYITNREQTKLNYPSHPYGKPAYRSEQSIRAVTLNDIQTFHQQHYAQDNAIVAIVGDINRSQAEQLVAQTLNGLPQKAQNQSPTPPVPYHGGHISRIPFAASTQTQISIGLPVLKYNDPDYFALIVGNYILGGGGFDSRLMKELRDKHGYTYGVTSSFAAYEQAAPFNISFGTERKNSEAALAAAQKVLADFVANGVTEDELKQAKAHITGSFPLRFDSNAKLIGNLVVIGLYNRPTDWLDTYNSKINAISAEDIRAAWQRHIKPEQMNIVLTGGEQK